MKGRVLLVDDDPMILECLGTILACEDFQVRAANSAAAAAAALEESEFDLVITDMAMETKTAGYDVVRAALRQPYRPVVFILTGVYIPASEWKERGVAELFTKGEGIPGTIVNAVEKIFQQVIRRRPVVASQHDLGRVPRDGTSHDA
jgi:CheY-like chemotaxis protein